MIRPGAQVTFSYSIHDGHGNVFTPTTITTATVGIGHLIETVDFEILSMKLNDKKDILIPQDQFISIDVDTLQSHEVVYMAIQIIDFINLPKNGYEMISFISVRSVSIVTLARIELITKGQLKIEKTYDMLQAAGIGQEYTVISAMCEERDKCDSIAAHLSSYEAYNPMLRISRTVSCIEHEPVGGAVRYILPVWSYQQQKASFLPSILHMAVASRAALIVLLDNDGDDDWVRDISVDQDEGGGWLVAGEVAMDVVIDAEEQDASGTSVLTSLRCNDGSRPGVSVSGDR